MTGKVDYLGLLISVKNLLDQIDKMRDKIPPPILKTCDDLRNDFKLWTHTPKSSEEAMEKQIDRVDKVVKNKFKRKEFGTLIKPKIA
jgi:hypothetical protein